MWGRGPGVRPRADPAARVDPVREARVGHAPGGSGVGRERRRVLDTEDARVAVEAAALAARDVEDGEPLWVRRLHDRHQVRQRDVLELAVVVDVVEHDEVAVLDVVVELERRHPVRMREEARRLEVDAVDARAVA